MERELKLEVLQDDVDHLIDLPLLAACRVEPPHEDTLVSTYFDTTDLTLHQHRVSLRVRQAGGHYVLTLKTYGKRSGGVYEREEFEATISGLAPDLGALQEKVPKDTALGELIRQSGLAERLKPLFVTDVRRKVALLRLPQGDEVELALDRGVIRAGEATVPIRELEMEIHTGEPGHLTAFALQLLDEVPMRISRASKGDQGYALVSAPSIEALRAEALRLDDDASAEAAFLCIAQSCLTQVAGNEGGVVNSANPKCVHQMRVGLRRLRSTLDLFRSLISCPLAIQDEIRWIAGELGPSRDWDVLAHSTLREAFDEAPADVDADAVVSAAHKIATVAKQRAAKAVNSERYTRLVFSFNYWLGTSAWRNELDEAQRTTLARPVGEFALKILDERHRKLLKRGRRMAKLDMQQRHRARIAAKKLRYATEFFASLLPAAKLRRYRNHLADMQDDLGWRNDMAVADSLLRSLGVENEGFALATGYARGYLAGRMNADSQSLRRLWKFFKAARPPV